MHVFPGILYLGRARGRYMSFSHVSTRGRIRRRVVRQNETRAPRPGLGIEVRHRHACPALPVADYGTDDQITRT
jgi:hypothetical protein